jgi:tetratricopeptide (TPR) repeat protein
VDTARYQRVRRLLHEAAEKAVPERRAWLESQAGADPSLVADVLALLHDDPVATRHVLPSELAAPGAVDLAPGTALGRHRVRSEIGRGGMGVVYEAEEEGTGRVVALKVILPHLLAVPSVRERFLREARLGLSIEHENVVRTTALEEASVGGARLHFLVMERVRGRTLRALLDEMGTVPEALWREIALQCARGLSALHDAGVVHRDLKPENVLLTDDRRVRIMDLGVAKAATASRALTTEGQFVGSVRYASPEQAAGGDVGPAADLYSLGVVLYELATGRTPFDADDPVALLRAHAEKTPVPAAERNPALSEFASEVTATLLAKRPEDRFASARDLARALEAGEAGSWWASRRRPRRAARPRPASAPRGLRLVGRDAERDALLEAWSAARGGEGRVALVLGEAGIGKTRLVEELLRAVADESATVLRSEAGLGEASGGLAAALATATGSDLEADLARRLALSPALAAAFAATLCRRGAPDAGPPLATAVAEGLVVRLSRSLAEERPLLWVVEDVHAADPDALRLLTAVARGVAGARLLLVVTARPGADPATMAALGLLPGALRIDLARLPEEAVGALAGEALGDPALGSHLGAALARRGDGIPFFVLEILRDLERRGHLVRGTDGAVREGRPLDEAEPPPALADLLRARLAALSPEERAVLDAAAVEGPEFDPALVAAARGIPRLEALDVLGRLERRHGLVRSGPVLCRFDHRLLQEVVLGDLPPALRALLHERLADAIEARPAGGDEPGARAWRVAAHRLRGPAPSGALPLAAAAVSWCDRTHRKAEAYDLARRAIAAAGDDPGAERVRLVLQAARLGLTLGRAAECDPLLPGALASARALGDGRLVALVRRTAAENAAALGRFEEALAGAREAAAEAARAQDEAEAVEARRVEGQALWCLGRLEEAREAFEEALRAAAALASPRPLARAAADLGIALHETGRLAEAEIHLRAALEVTRQADDRVNLGAITSNLGNVLHDAGRKAEALACYETAIAIDQALGQRVGEAIGWVNVGETRLRLGDLAGARAAFRLAEELAVESASARVEAYALHGLGLVAESEGDRAEARRRFAGALARRRAIGNRSGVAETCLALGALAAAEGGEAEARGLLEEAARLAEEASDPSVLALARIRLAALPGGDPAAARRAFAEAGRRLRHDARLEGHFLLWRATGDPSDLRAAKRLLAEQRRHAPPGAAAGMVEHVPLLRAIADAPDPGPEAASGASPPAG